MAGLTPKQSTELQQLLQIGSDNAVPGSWLQPATVTQDKLAGDIPGSKIASLPASKITGTLGSGQFVELDPVFLGSPAAAISNGLIASWNTAFGWGNHAAAGYLTSAPTLRKDIFVATGGQTVFALAATPVAAHLVFQQGLALQETVDYMISGSALTLVVGATVSDVVQVLYTA